MLSFQLAIWLVATMGHVLLSARWANRLIGDARCSLDERIFAAILGAVGSLSVVLHAAALIGGLTFGRGLLGLICWHVLLWGLTRRASVGELTTGQPRSGLAGLEILSVGMTVAVLMAWLDISSMASAVSGTDAAYYHAPVAVHFALGSSLFDLPPTPHLYPMGGSVIAAWFILPTGDLLMVDFAMCLPFLVLGAAINCLFRLATDRSGLMWSSWVTLGLFSTPMFRASSLVSADLWFAAGFVALTAAVTAVWARRACRAGDTMSCALALGLLAGSKSSGAVAGVLILGACAIAEATSWAISRRRTAVGRPLRSGALFALVTIAAGGIWLVRNYLQFGSPLAPVGLSLFGMPIFVGDEPGWTTYWSVLGDLQIPGYRLALRARHFIRLWFGQWYFTALVPMAFIPLDLLIGIWIRSRAHVREVRSLLAFLVLGAGGCLVWLLIGAPWTSLEWTKGLSLRYALPVAALWPLLAFIGLFPTTWPWYDDAVSAKVVGAVVASVSLWMLWMGLQAVPQSGLPLPAATAASLIVGAAVALVTVQTLGLSSRGRTGVAVLGILLAAAWWAPVIARRDAGDRAGAVRHLSEERAAFAQGVAAGNPTRTAYLAVLADEDQHSRACVSRRFFALSRDDEPLLLQSADYRNRVFYAARDVDAARRAGPLTACDYILTTGAVMGTDKGTLLASAIANGAATREIVRVDTVVVLGLDSQ